MREKANACPPHDRRFSRRAQSASCAWPPARMAVRPSFLSRLADLVNRVARHDDDDFRIGVVDDGLASEPRRRRQPGRFVEQVFLLLARFAELVETLLDDHVTGGARAITAACVLEMHSVPQHHVEDRARLAIVMKRRLSGVELDYLFGVAVFKLDSQFRHRSQSQLRLWGASTLACIFA